MALFASEDDVRLNFQMFDTSSVPTALIDVCIDNAHEQILRRLADEYVDATTETGLVTGEALLAGAFMFRALGAKAAQEQKNITVGGQRLESDRRFASLMAAGSIAEEQAWFMLEPYLEDVPSRVEGEGTSGVEVM